MERPLTIRPRWNEIDAVYTGRVLGHPEIDEFRAGPRRADFERLVAGFMGAQNPPRDFRIAWPGRPVEFHIAA